MATVRIRRCFSSTASFSAGSCGARFSRLLAAAAGALPVAPTSTASAAAAIPEDLASLAFFFSFAESAATAIGCVPSADAPAAAAAVTSASSSGAPLSSLRLRLRSSIGARFSASSTWGSSSSINWLLVVPSKDTIGRGFPGLQAAPTVAWPWAWRGMGTWALAVARIHRAPEALCNRGGGVGWAAAALTRIFRPATTLPLSICTARTASSGSANCTNPKPRCFSWPLCLTMKADLMGPTSLNSSASVFSSTSNDTPRTNTVRLSFSMVSSDDGGMV